MLYSFSKHAFVNLLKRSCNITSLHNTYLAFSFSSSPRNVYSKSYAIKYRPTDLIFVRSRKIKFISSVAVNWKLLCQVSGAGLSLGLRPNTPSTKSLIGGTEIKPSHKTPCSLKKNITIEFHPRSKSKNYFVFILWKIWDFFFTFLRFLRLGFTLLPVLILYPFSLTCISLKDRWYRLLLFSLELSGPIFIKLGQWASTRRDLFSEELCSHLEKLQRKNKPHSWYYTSKSLERVFGPHWQNILMMDNGGQPVGSGCCAQVYMAWVDCDVVMEAEEASRSSKMAKYNNEDEYENSFAVEVLEMFGIGRLLSAFRTPQIIMEEDKSKLIPVAVKVLHPRMSTLLRRDLCIMKVGANVLTWLFPGLKWISLPECVDDFTALMKAQVDFCIEANNLELFAANFAKVDSVHFPRPFWSLTTPFCLVETYEDGKPMEHYIKNEESKETKVKLADIGVNTLLKMVFDDNFAHGDLHPGNILVQERKCDLKDEWEWWKFGKKKTPKQPLRLVILDCGIVVSLDMRGKRLLRQVFRAVANGDGERVAELFLNNSTHQCPSPDNFKKAMRELVLSALGKTMTLSGIEVSSLIAQLFATMIQHKVKMDGCFSSVILAMMVVEGMGRSLDPTINMVETARPYLFRPIKNM